MKGLSHSFFIFLLTFLSGYPSAEVLGGSWCPVGKEFWKNQPEITSVTRQEDLSCFVEVDSIPRKGLMYDSYPIDKVKEVFFKKYTDMNFDFDRFDYFLEYDA